MTLLGQITPAQVLDLLAVFGLLLILGIVNFHHHRGADAAERSDSRR